jgi:hypothetical protein
VAAIDTPQATPADTVKLYVNGVQETLFSTSTYPAQDYQFSIGTASDTMKVGTGTMAGATNYWNGVMAHVHYTDGQVYAPTAFGETDATSGIWIAKTGPSVTYGNNGIFLKFASGALGTDSSGNGNTMTVTGTMTTTKDTPDNNFATMNPLERMGGSSPTFSNGNNTYLQGGTSQYYPSTGTMGLTAGLWYWECLYTGGVATLFGIAGDAAIATNMAGTVNNYLGWSSLQWALYCETGVYYTGTTGTSYGVAVAADDIVGVYLDLTANKLYFAKNGTVMNSGTGISITAVASTTAGYYVPSASYWGSNNTFKFNFGNGYFGTTVVTSGVADAGGEGTFEYDPSAGTFDGSSKDFRALCTNNLATYG